MKNNSVFYTASMAKLCADQGYYDKSLEIYRFLLESDSENEVLRRSISEMESKIAAGSKASGTTAERLAPMIRKWVGLMVEHDLKLKFDKIRKNVKNFQSSEH